MLKGVSLNSFGRVINQTATHCECAFILGTARHNDLSRNITACDINHSVTDGIGAARANGTTTTDRTRANGRVARYIQRYVTTISGSTARSATNGNTCYYIVATNLTADTFCIHLSIATYVDNRFATMCIGRTSATDCRSGNALRINLAAGNIYNALVAGFACGTSTANCSCRNIFYTFVGIATGKTRVVISINFTTRDGNNRLTTLGCFANATANCRTTGGNHSGNTSTVDIYNTKAVTATADCGTVVSCGRASKQGSAIDDNTLGIVGIVAGSDRCIPIIRIYTLVHICNGQSVNIAVGKAFQNYMVGSNCNAILRGIFAVGIVNGSQSVIALVANGQIGTRNTTGNEGDTCSCTTCVFLTECRPHIVNNKQGVPNLSRHLDAVCGAFAACCCRIGLPCVNHSTNICIVGDKIAPCLCSVQNIIVLRQYQRTIDVTRLFICGYLVTIGLINVISLICAKRTRDFLSSRLSVEAIACVGFAADSDIACGEVKINILSGSWCGGKFLCKRGKRSNPPKSGDCQRDYHKTCNSTYAARSVKHEKTPLCLPFPLF